jgi:hypothetical protein
MATSGVYSFSVVRDDIIREAMLNIGKLGEAENPTAQEVTDCARKLNMLVKQWMAKQDFAPGLKVWTRRHSDLFLSQSKGFYYLGPTGDNWANGVAAVPGVASVQNKLNVTASASATTLSFGVGNVGQLTANDFIFIVLDSGVGFQTTVSSINVGAGTIVIAPGIPTQASSGAFTYNWTTKGQRPEVIETVVLRDSTGADINMRVMNLEDYDNLSSKQQPGFLTDPSFVYYEAQLTNGVLYTDVYGAQDVSKYLHISYMEPIQDFVNPTDNPEYPQAWYLALCWGLTKQIAPMFNLPFSKDMEDNLKEATAIAREAFSDNKSMFFQCNAQP